jgi:hypothetical protein
MDHQMSIDPKLAYSMSLLILNTPLLWFAAVSSNFPILQTRTIALFIKQPLISSNHLLAHPTTCILAMDHKYKMGNKFSPTPQTCSSSHKAKPKCS